MKSLLIIIAWVVAGVFGAVLIGYVPGALDLIDDYQLGRLLGLLLWPITLLFGIAGMLFVQRRFKAAYLLSGTVVAAYVALLAYIVVKLPSARTPHDRSVSSTSKNQTY